MFTALDRDSIDCATSRRAWVVALSLALLPGCSGSSAKPCTIKDNGDGSKTITCDATQTTVKDGTSGAGVHCTAKDNGSTSTRGSCHRGRLRSIHRKAQL